MIKMKIKTCPQGVCYVSYKNDLIVAWNFCELLCKINNVLFVNVLHLLIMDIIA